MAPMPAGACYEQRLSAWEVAMKRMAFGLLAFFCATAFAHAQSFSADDLNNRLVHRRAVEAVIWAMPAVNYDLMLQAMLNKTEGKINQFIYWSRPSDWKNQTLTPNPDAIYFLTFFNTKEEFLVSRQILANDRHAGLSHGWITNHPVPVGRRRTVNGSAHTFWMETEGN